MLQWSHLSDVDALAVSDLAWTVPLCTANLFPVCSIVWLTYCLMSIEGNSAFTSDLVFHIQIWDEVILFTVDVYLKSLDFSVESTLVFRWLVKNH